MTYPRQNKIASLYSVTRVFLLGCAAVLASSAFAQSNYATPYTVTTVAGTAGLTSGVIDGTGAAAVFSEPAGEAVDSNGNIFVADTSASTIRKITPAGVVTTFAGRPGVSGSTDGTGSGALFFDPSGVTIDSSGNLFVADQGNNTVRKVTPAGVVTTFAGTAGVAGSADGTGAAAQFTGPYGIAVDGSGNVYVSDQLNNTIRKITSAGVVTTFAGAAGVAGITDGQGATARFRQVYGLRCDSSGNIFVADAGNSTIRKITSGGAVTTIAGTAGKTGYADGAAATALFNAPTGVAVDSSGNVWVSDFNNNVIREVSASGSVSTFAGVAKIGGSVDGTGTRAEFYGPFDVAIDAGGNLFVSDVDNQTIRKITPAAVVTTLAGVAQGGNADGTGAAARFARPTGVAIDRSGSVYVTDENNDTIRKITAGGVVTTFAGLAGNAGSADGTGSAAQFDGPFRLTVDPSGNIFVSDFSNNTIRKITPGGTVSTFAGTPTKAGATDGTGSAALLDGPVGIAADSNGNIYVAEQTNNIVRKFTPAGVSSTFAGTAGAVGSADGTGAAASFRLPAGLAVDPSGNVYVADYGNDTIRKITPGGVVTTLAGVTSNPGHKDGTGTAASFYLPVGLVSDSSGNLYVAEQANNDIRKVTPAGVVTTLAGAAPPIVPVGQQAPLAGHADGTGALAEFNAPYDVAVDANGNLYIADSGNNEIRFATFSAAPQIQTQPASQSVTTGGSATFSVSAVGSTALSYQWNFNNNAISGATGSSYTVSGAQASDAGSYSVTVTDNAGSTTSSSATLGVFAPGTQTARLTNISTRALVGTGGNILIPGFHIAGSGTETLLVRAVGPTLASFSVTGVLAQPVLTVLDGSGAVIATNTGWGSASNSAQIASVTQGVTFALTAGGADSALLVTLQAGASYTVQVSGLNATTGVALAEVYEISYTGSARLSNISTRAQVGTGGNILIPGFVISGTGTEKLLVRADGPVLTTFSVTGALAQPNLEILSGSSIVASNAGWGTATDAAQIATAAVGVTFALPVGSADSAEIVNLAPGPYTVQVAGVSNSTGVALAEIYEIQ
ncbi:MAG TPA: immunoglobulin domain-containing protein [Opitutaceae bacterium]|jgi:streptogramin lyase|nr:immunoglobulin domain-containing protein [Opitutaceae bacterium]